MLDLIVHAELRARMCRLGLQRATHFSWRKTAQETLDVYCDVLERRQAVEARAVSATISQQ
jgi:glycosyltransferase involved in cell wall biosynthesis